MPGSQKNKHHLAVIKEPPQDTRTVLISDTGGAIFTGSEAGPVLLCGKCEWILVSGRRRERLGDWVLKCSRCGAFNDTSLSPTPAKEPLEAPTSHSVVWSPHPRCAGRA